jgi:hypothetical protein
MKTPKNLVFEPVHLKNVLLASVVHGISCLFEIRLSGSPKNPDIFLQKSQKCVEELKFCMNELFNNVFKAFFFLKCASDFFTYSLS